MVYLNVLLFCEVFRKIKLFSNILKNHSFLVAVEIFSGLGFAFLSLSGEVFGTKSCFLIISTQKINLFVAEKVTVFTSVFTGKWFSKKSSKPFCPPKLPLVQ